LRDLLWIPAKLQTGPSFQSQDLGEVFLPVIYPLSWRNSDDNVRLGRVTEWMEDPAGEISPFGQKILLVDGEEIPFLEIRNLEIYPASSSPRASEG
jgi:type VI secretion system protein ImpE